MEDLARARRGHRHDTDGVVQWSKFCVASWRKDASGFYYGALDRPLSGDEYLEKVHGQRVLFHRLGTGQQDDSLSLPRPTNRSGWPARPSPRMAGTWSSPSGGGRAPRRRCTSWT